MLRFEGERLFDMSPAELWPRLRNAGFLVRCVPDATIVGTPTREQAACVVQPGIAFVRGSLDVTLEVIDAEEPSRVRLRVVSKGVGSGSTLEATLALEPHARGVRVVWTAVVTELTGLLKAVPPGLIRGAARKVIDDLWQGVEEQIAAEAPPPQAPG